MESKTSYKDRRGYIHEQDNSYWVTDYYCRSCNSYLKYPKATNAKQYNAARSLDLSMWLWMPVYIGLAILFHQKVSQQISQLSSGRGQVVIYVILVLLLPLGCCWMLHRLLPEVIVENIALLIRAPIITALEAFVMAFSLALIGFFKIISLLGRGGFGETYLAEDIRRMERQCVVKRLQPASSDPNTLREAKLLFESEARTLEKLGKEHDQIPDLLDYFEENQEFYLVQELVEGKPVDVILATAGRLSEAQVIALLLDVLTVLSFVHQYQVIHRDIKPSNLMQRYKDGKRVLIDFGAVKQVQAQVVNSQGQTTFSRVISTPGYMPQEQGVGKPRFSSDIYALGMVAIEALTGLAPSQLSEDVRTGEILWQERAYVSTASNHFR